MNLVIISGLSGSGKSIALHTLEDMGYNCIDNLPVGLLKAFSNEFTQPHLRDITRVAAGIDARNHPDQISHFPAIISDLQEQGIDCKILFLQAENHTLLKRFSETRRKHPLTGPATPLADAIEKERELLAPITARADLFIDTTRTNIHQLRDLIKECMGAQETSGLSLVLRSFGYKHGVPADADFVFDARCLPNPHWEPDLRKLTGLDNEVIEFLDGEPLVHEFYRQIEQFLATWVPRYGVDNRSYLSIAIGCTGGQHRSVYLVERLAKDLGEKFGSIVTRHRELE
ncbi:MAG: RNase adapter RapZ [Gammaproteobacteria bacterium]|nr:RNase adapter RapZ [Gammaproteobacteria bacterium]MDH3559646.1 RNase adapter RapZ [Gammaproteobacteria bacterium]